MHDGPWIYVGERVVRYGPFNDVVEFGGRVVNGTVRDHFSPPTRYVSIDQVPGPGVDIVADVVTWRSEERFDVVVCCEVLEHTPFPLAVIASAHEALKDNGYLILTCAVAPRPPHGNTTEHPQPGEYYGNPEPGLIVGHLCKLFGAVEARIDGRHGDLYVTAVKGDGDL